MQQEKKEADHGRETTTKEEKEEVNRMGDRNHGGDLKGVLQRRTWSVGSVARRAT